MFSFKLPSPPPPPLAKISAPTAAEVAAKYPPPPAGPALLQPHQTPPQYLQTLEQNKQPVEAVNFLAHGMPERESVWWACQSSQKVAGKLNTADHSALSAAEAWVKNPAPETQAAAAAAAAQTDFKGPGGWAAQAAAWSRPPAPAVAAPAVGLPAAPAVAAPSLTAPAVAGAVLLAAGLANRPPMPEVPSPGLPSPTLPPPPVMPQPSLAPPPPPEVPPLDNQKLSPMLQPFIDLGKGVASGQNTWA